MKYQVNTIIGILACGFSTIACAQQQPATGVAPTTASTTTGASPAAAATHAPSTTDPSLETLKIWQVPNIGTGAEFYFSPDSKKLIGNAKREGDENHFVYTLNVDGTDIRRLNDKGQDACSFFLWDNQHVVWTSTRDNLDLPPGEWSSAWNYPQGAEIYISDLEGENIKRITNNKIYDAEVTPRYDGKYLVVGRQTDGKMDLWRVSIDGSEPDFQVTSLEGKEPGGVQYVPGTNKLLFRAWLSADEERKSKEPKARWPLPMDLYTVNDDGTELTQLTDDGGTNWAPFPAPDGKHYVFAKIFDGRNYEIILGNYENKEQVRLTYNDAFDGMPSISPDGKLLHFSSSRGSKPGERNITLYLADISHLNITPYTPNQTTTTPAAKPAY